MRGLEPRPAPARRATPPGFPPARRPRTITLGYFDQTLFEPALDFVGAQRVYPDRSKKAGGTATTMLDRVTALPTTVESPVTAMLAYRRALFAVLVGTTMAAVLWLAIVAVPPYSAGAIAFLVLFTITLPWSVIGFWNATIGFL